MAMSAQAEVTALGASRRSKATSAIHRVKTDSELARPEHTEPARQGARDVSQGLGPVAGADLTRLPCRSVGLARLLPRSSPPGSGPESEGATESPPEPIVEHEGDEVGSVEPTQPVDTEGAVEATEGEVTTPLVAEGGREPDSQAAPAAAGGTATPRTVIRGPRNMWYFNGQTPANYLVSSPLSTNKSGGTFQWSTSAHLTLSSATAARPDVTTAARTPAQRGAWIRVQHTDAAGIGTAASYRLTVREPAALAHINDVDSASATWGYESHIHYSIQDQFAVNLPRNVPINEQWTGGIVADAAGMDWRRGAEGSATVNPANWLDRIQGESAGHTPAPVAPGQPGAATAVYHWPGDWRVGSLTIGSGSNVASVTWQKNRGFARHT